MERDCFEPRPCLEVASLAVEVRSSGSGDVCGASTGDSVCSVW